LGVGFNGIAKPYLKFKVGMIGLMEWRQETLIQENHLGIRNEWEICIF
jgi:hypothetical protein